MTLRIAIIGKTGQLARALCTEGEAFGHEISAFGRNTLNLASAPSEIEKSIANISVGLDAIILAAAYTDVDGAESDTKTAYNINSIATAIIARCCAKYRIPLIYISTDYVFDGQANTPYKPDDSTNPLGVYGASKLNGELAVLDSGVRALIIRTSWLYDGIGQNFLTTVKRLSAQRRTISIVDDQIGRPTFTEHLAQANLKATDIFSTDLALKTAIYHVTNGGEPVSWAGFAKAIFNTCNQDINVITIPTSDYPTLAERPAYSVLDIDSFERTFRHRMPDWQMGLRSALEAASVETT